MYEIIFHFTFFDIWILLIYLTKILLNKKIAIYSLLDCSNNWFFFSFVRTFFEVVVSINFVFSTTNEEKNIKRIYETKWIFRLFSDDLLLKILKWNVCNILNLYTISFVYVVQYDSRGFFFLQKVSFVSSSTAF